MPTYRVVFLGPLGDTPVRSISFDDDDPGRALLLAQNYDGPAELWREDERLCTLLRTGNCGELWVISGRKPKPRRETAPPDEPGGTFMLRAGSESTTQQGADSAAPEDPRRPACQGAGG